MSIRPSTLARQVTSVTPSSYIIIGNSSLATIWATKLFQTFQNITTTRPNIYVLSSGNNAMTNVNVEALDFIIRYNNSINKYLVTDKLNVIASTEFVAPSLDTSNILHDQYFNYFYGSGPNGDMTTAYYTCIVGPWFTSDSKGQIQAFVKNSTIQKELTQNERIIVTNLASLLNLSMTNSIVATKPSILTLNNIFVYNEGSKLERRVFRELYVELNHDPTVNTVTHVTSLYVTPDTANSCLSTVTYTTIREPTAVTVSNACVMWMDNLYSYVKTLGISGDESKKVLVPAFYRIVFSIPEVNSTGVNLSNLNPTEYPLNIGDGLTTRITFCCTDVQEPGETMNNTTPTWNVTAYTTKEDFSDEGAAFASPGKSLLIVEALSLTNRRNVSWDSINQTVSIHYNSNSLELGRRNAFLLVAANVYYATTGTFPVLPTGPSTVCDSTGLCSDFSALEHFSARESPMHSVMRLLTTLYGNSTYPVPITCCS